MDKGSRRIEPTWRPPATHRGGLRSSHRGCMLFVCEPQADSEMTVRVAIVRSRDDLLAELIERQIEDSPALLLVAAELVDPNDNAEDRLGVIAQHTDVLIAIGE